MQWFAEKKALTLVILTQEGLFNTRLPPLLQIALHSNFACDSVCLTSILIPSLSLFLSLHPTQHLFASSDTVHKFSPNNMADPQATALRSDSDYLLRIKTDTKELSSKQHEAQRKIDAIRAQIYREGPTAILSSHGK